MDEPILPDPTQTQPAPNGSPAPEPEVEKPPAPVQDPRVDQLAAQVERLVNQLGVLANTPAPQAPTPPPPPRPSNELLEELAADPEGFVRKIAREQAGQVVTEAVNPVLMQNLSATTQTLVQNHANAIDSRFGAGAWDEVFRSTLEENLSQLREANPGAVVNPATMQALVDRVAGANLEKLAERRTAHQQEMKDQEKQGLERIVSMIPTGGVPRLRANQEGELPDDVKDFVKHVDGQTGRTTDIAQFAKLYGSGSSDGRNKRTDIADYLKAHGVDAETRKQYGC